MPKRTAEESGLADGSPKKRTSTRRSGGKPPEPEQPTNEGTIETPVVDTKPTTIVPDVTPVETEVSTNQGISLPPPSKAPETPASATTTTNPNPPVGEGEATSTAPDTEEGELMDVDKEKQSASVPKWIPRSSKESIKYSEFVQKLFNAFSETVPKKYDIAVEKIRALVLEYFSEDDTQLQKQKVDQAVKEYVLHTKKMELSMKKTKHGCAGCAIGEVIVEICILLAQEEIGTISLPFQALSDIIEFSDVPTLEQVFSYMEKRIELWLEPRFFNPCKNLVLRMCNDILRRLSQIQNTIFCGRVLIFLSRYFPFSERSGLNVMSEFNTDNSATSSTIEGSDVSIEHMDEDKMGTLFDGMNIAIPGLDKVITQFEKQKRRNFHLDYNMYIKFWQLQEFLRNPNQCYTKANWKLFGTHLNDMLEAFESSKLINGSTNINCQEMLLFWRHEV